MGLIASFDFSTGSVLSYDFASSRKEFQWLASVFTGIIFCVIVYRLMDIMSSLLFMRYGKLSDKQKIEWNNRGFSTVHAIFASVVSFYLLMRSDLFSDDSREELIVHRSSTFSNSVLGISVGYFLTDLAMILWYYPALGGMEYILHHGLSLFSIIQALLSGQAQIYILMVLFTESTTPFVNLRWHLDVAGLKSSKLYIWNGVALFFGWLIARIILFIFFFLHMYNHFDEVKQIFPLGYYSVLTVPATLAMMNVYWFWKIARGMVKTLAKAKEKKHDE
ncbi:uncharacterized protein LOC130948937 isoform X1 [Arachis stenosperma]|uniref:uncharacterized protein LOC130948937 isoform X1 n=1 Tax=Arachis stenosperma TaxID=217475 RepID=UPI0025AD866E|nr:uncharacterized protein LOC130948937 isoform X1 [Arachis stenosperma]XP_057733848.1 uncharacterized protein LOC130948937 isoform X1 [Arachis stenosperma]